MFDEDRQEWAKRQDRSAREIYSLVQHSLGLRRSIFRICLSWVMPAIIASKVSNGTHPEVIRAAIAAATKREPLVGAVELLV